MIQDEFSKLRLKLIAISLAFSFIPLFSLGLGLYDKFYDTYTDKVHGNLRNLVDNKKITKGTRLYFPVRVPGALLQMGDVHATMGDAELCGTGIEIPAEITVRVQLVKDFELNWPVLETFGPDGKWYVNCSGTHYEQALMNGSKELQRLLMRVTGWDAVETYMYMSVQSDVEVSQGCEPCEVDVSLRIGTPKLSEFPVLIPQP